jgi:DNA-binding response OmpR family regulator
MTSLRRAVLVVDDDDGFRRLVSSLLEQAGYATVEAVAGEEALAAAGRERPSLVLLDVKLPGISGYEVCRRLKEDFGSDLPVFLVSGVRTEPFDRAAGLLIGADDYLTKPVDPDELLARVRKSALPTAEAAGTTGSALEQLTDRERHVLRLLAQGLAQQEIARSLVVSNKTVATHIQHVLERDTRGCAASPCMPSLAAASDGAGFALHGRPGVGPQCVGPPLSWNKASPGPTTGRSPESRAARTRLPKRLGSAAAYRASTASILRARPFASLSAWKAKPPSVRGFPWWAVLGSNQ